MLKFRPDMTHEEVARWCEEKLEWLRKKQRRELDYITRRANKGIHTLTDDAYEKDQPHEADLLEMLKHLFEEAGK